MSKKQERLKHRLRNAPDASISWMDGGYLPGGGYETSEITGVQISLMPEGYEDIYLLTIVPGDEFGTYDAWVRRMGSTDMVHMLSKRARDPEDVAVAALENLPEYIGLV